MNRKKIISSMIVVAFLLITMFSVVNIFGVSKEAKNIEITDIDLSKSNDGEFEGKYSISPVSVNVKIRIENKKITNIDINKHENGIGFRAEKPIAEAVIKEQSIKVDTVSGATISSKAILKAIENAVNKSNTSKN